MKTKTKRAIDYHLKAYVFCFCMCLCFLSIDFISSGSRNVIANVISIIDLDFFSAFRGGNPLDPVDFANFKIL